MALSPEQARALSTEELARLARDAVPMDSRSIEYASALTISQAGNDFVLTFARPRPALLPSGEVAPFMKQEVTNIIYLSPLTLKDFYLALRDQIEKYEAQHGQVETDYSKQFEE